MPKIIWSFEKKITKLAKSLLSLLENVLEGKREKTKEKMRYAQEPAYSAAGVHGVRLVDDKLLRDEHREGVKDRSDGAHNDRGADTN